MRGLHPRVQRAARERGVHRLRPVQEELAALVRDGDGDALLVAGTSAGKTEAAWLPVLSRLLQDPPQGFGAVAVYPLKALINEQATRLQAYGDLLGIPVQPWHGDVAPAARARRREQPSGVLLITPESLEAQLIHHPVAFAAGLRDLRFVVVDEVHAFFASPRGAQLQSLLGRIDRLVGARPPRRLGLSATVGDRELARAFLRPEDPGRVTVLGETGCPLDAAQVLVAHKFRDRGPDDVPAAAGTGRPAEHCAAHRLDLAQDIAASTRGARALAFAPSRPAVEELVALLRDPDVTGTPAPDRYLAHHGSLAADLRRHAEEQLHQRRDAVLVSTTTLELGIDLPDVEIVVQVDAPPTCNGLRQRVGRSGRSPGRRASLRMHVAESEATADEPVARLRTGLVQAVAVARLALDEGWVEPHDPSVRHYGVLAHQVLSLAAHPEGTGALDAYEVLCGRGPWPEVDERVFAALLRHLASLDALRQEVRTGCLHLGEQGERWLTGRDGCAVFLAARDLTLRHAGKELGRLPHGRPLLQGDHLVFDGRYWQVEEVGPGGWVVDVVPARGGKPPQVSGGTFRRHDRVVQTMRDLYAGDDLPALLDEQGQRFLVQGREAFRRLGLDVRLVAPAGRETVLATWAGDRTNQTLQALLARAGLASDLLPVGLRLHQPWDDVARVALEELAACPLPDPGALASTFRADPGLSRWDHLLPPDLRQRDVAAAHLDVPAAAAVLQEWAAEV